jgi:Tol biopolymer transport system component/DNA-binding winged helix-turn-helix (wHTH) protein
VKRAARHYAFGPYVLDGLRGVLWEGTTAVPLTPRVFDLLVALVEQHGDVLEKDELIRKVWGQAIVEENNLARHISTLRKALHERPGQRDYIATIPSIGYRFVAEVVELDRLPSELTHAPLTKANPVPHHTVVGPETTASPGPLDTPHAPATPPPAQPRRLLRVAVVGAVVVATAVAVGFGTRTYWHREARHVQRTLAELTYEPGLQRDPAWSPDGRMLAFASDRSGNFDIWVQDITDGVTTPVTTSGFQESQPDWSPDGQAIVFRSERDGGGLYVIPVRGGQARRVSPFGSRPRWSPSGDQILFSYAEPNTGAAVKMYVVNRDGSAPRVIGHPALTGFNTTSAAWHPDGRVSFWGRRGLSEWEFITVPLSGDSLERSELNRDARTRLSNGELELSAFTWSKSGHFLYFEGQSHAVRNLWRVSVDAATLAWQGEPERLTTGPGADGGVAVSPDGRQLAFGVAAGHPAVWSFPFDPVAAKLKGPGTALTSGDFDERGADAWMDGERIVYLASRNNREELWERSQDAVPHLLLAATDWTRSSPRWSPDGTLIAYHRRPRNAGRGDGAVAVLSVDAKQERLLTTPGTGEVIPSDWSSDSQRLLATCRFGSEERLGTCILPVSGSRTGLRRLSSDDRLSMFQQRFSPNEKWISFIAVTPGDRSVARIYLMPAEGGAWIPVTDGTAYDDKPRWSPDGRTLYFISNREGRSNVWGQRIEPDTGAALGSPFRVTAFDEGRQSLAPYIGQLTMSVTPTRIVLPMYEATGQIWVLDGVDQ